MMLLLMVSFFVLDIFYIKINDLDASRGSGPGTKDKAALLKNNAAFFLGAYKPSLTVG